MQERSKLEQKDRGTRDALTEVLRVGARKLMAQALEAEVAEWLIRCGEERDDQDQARVIRSGHHPEGALQTKIGPVLAQVPKVRSRQGEPVTFRSALVSPYVCKARSLEAALPWVSLKGISTGEKCRRCGGVSRSRGSGPLSQYGGAV